MPFTASLALSILEGRKTQTRRVIPDRLTINADIDKNDPTYFFAENSYGDFYPGERFAPHQKGDVLWIREPGRVVAYEESPDCQYEWMRIKYMADDHEEEINTPWRMSEVWDSNGQKFPYGAPNWVWKKQGIPNGIFKEAARLFVKITDVRVERVQDISIEDCIAEGIGDEETPCPVRRDRIHSDAWYDGEGCEACGALSARELFHSLWHDLYPGSWERNDWVWVYEFERTERPANWPQN
ncbi:hypothetical protein [Pseudodesulfovibrio tunisiensis]|uniref:hypothetical protein n=1 Tax=Pseudodesulfovibrio tunisiensis TaxID=463192 RepID=UPI001FB296F2|nr:hypothetical protein [Pseudodesulfovibrio tunisiensis]